MKKIVLLLSTMAVLLAFAGFYQPATAYAEDDSLFVVLHSKEEFLNFAKSPNSYDGKTVMLDTNIRFDNSVNNLSPIVSFHGTFDGQGHTITAIRQSQDDSAGLFKNATGEIKNLILKDCEFSASNGKAAAIAVSDSNAQPVMINNCHIINTNVSGGLTAAGIASGSKISSIKNCSVVNGTANKITSSGSAAGISTFCKSVENCMNTGTVESTNTVDQGAAGIIYQASYVNNCFNVGNIVAANSEHSSQIATMDATGGGSVLKCYSPSSSLAAVASAGKNVTIEVSDMSAAQMSTSDFATTLNTNIASRPDLFSWELRNNESTYPLPSKLIDIHACSTSLDATTFTYNGSRIIAKPTVTKGATTLIEGIDYFTVYQNNIQAGTASATIYGRNYYTGNTTLTYTIAKATPVISSKSTIGTDTYSCGAKLALNGTINEGDPGTILTYSSSDSKIATVTGTGNVTFLKPGAVTILMTYPETANYSSISQSFTYKINPTKLTLSVSSKKAKQLVAKWKKNASANGYELEISANKNFKGYTKKYKLKSNKKITYTVKGLKRKNTYYVRARAYKTVSVNGFKSTLYSGWVKKSVKIK